MADADRVLVAAWSRHGATAEIARHIAEQLEADGSSVQLVLSRQTAGTYADFVIGSPLYGARSCGGALELARRVRESGARLWLFSSGMQRPERVTAPVGFSSRLHQHAHGSAYFQGRLDRSLLSRAERAVIDLLGVDDADGRDWSAVTAWAAAITAVRGAGVAHR